MLNSNNYIMKSTKKSKHDNSNFWGLMPDSTITFYTTSRIQVILLVIECGSPFSICQTKKDQDKWKLLIEMLFCQTQLIGNLKTVYKDIIDEQTAKEIFQLETFWVQVYSIEIIFLFDFNRVINHTKKFQILKFELVCLARNMYY